MKFKKLALFLILCNAAVSHAGQGAFRIECKADVFGKVTKVALEYNLKYPETFGIGYGERARTDRLVAYNLTDVGKKKIEGTDITYLAVYFDDSPFNDADYPNHKYVTQNKLRFYSDSSLGISSAKLSVDKSRVERVYDNDDKNFRDCISIGVW